MTYSRRHAERIASETCTRCAKTPAVARPQGMRDLPRQAPCRRPRPARKGQGRGKAVRRPGSRSLPTRRPRPGQAPPSGVARRGALHQLRPQPARGRPLRLRALPRGEARGRSPPLCRSPRRRCLCALLGAGGRRVVALRPARRAGSRARLARTKESRRSQTLCQAQGAGALHGLWRPRGPHGALSRLRPAVQYASARASRCAGRAALLHRDRAGYPGGPRDLRVRGRGCGLPRLRRAATRSGGNPLQHAPPGTHAHGVAAGMPPVRGDAPKPEAQRRAGSRSRSPAPARPTGKRK